MAGSALRRELNLDVGSGLLVAERATACGRCAQTATCGAKVLTPRQRVTIALPLTSSAADACATRYEARFPARDLLALCAVVFPLLALSVLCGAYMATAWLPTAGDLSAALGAFAGLAVGAAGLRLYDSTSGRRNIESRLIVVPSGQGSPDEF